MTKAYEYVENYYGLSFEPGQRVIAKPYNIDAVVLPPDESTGAYVRVQFGRSEGQFHPYDLEPIP